MTYQLLFCTLLVIALPTPAVARECDNFTNRFRPVRDSLEAVDAFTNLRIDRAVISANKGKIACDRQRLYDKLTSKLASTPVGQVESWAGDTKDIDRLQDNQNGPESIYNKISFFEYPLMTFGIAHSVRINGHVIGVDKFGHFMAEGHAYYSRIVEKGGSWEKAVRWGHNTEEGYFGLSVSGVKSFGDLAANYGGAHFWLSILDGKDPYFTCRDGKFEKIRKFTWADYVNDAWDEAINCSQFTFHVTGVVTAALLKKGMTCPVRGTEQTCADLVQLPDSQYYVSPVCRVNPLKSDQVFNPGSLQFWKTNGRRGD